MAINVFTASGNIGKDCESRTTPNGKIIAHFSLPVKQGYGDHEKTSWVTCKLFGAKAEKLPQYLTKGTKVTVVGEFVLEEWTGQDGTQNKMPTIIVNSIDFGGKQQGQQQQGGQGQPQRQASQQQPQQQWEQATPPMDDIDSDIPFAPIGLMYNNSMLHCI